MPSLSQIIPKYTVPHVQTYINDNSTVTNIVSEPVETGTRLLCVFASPKGEDGVVKTMRSPAEYLNEYGVPNYSLYGQAGYMPYVALNTGNAICHCMRIAPADATYAAVGVCAVVTEDASTGAHTVKFIADDLGTISSKDGLLLALENKANPIVGGNSGADYVYPLFAVVAKGRGMYGNSLAVRIATDSILNAENSFMNYTLDVIDSSSGTPAIKEQFRGSFYSDAIVNSQSLFFDDVISDPDTGSVYVEIVTSSTNFEKFVSDINSFSTTTTTTLVSLTGTDVFTALTKDNGTVDLYTIDTTSADAINVSADLGISLTGGSDGSFSSTNSDADRNAAMDAQYIEAFTNLSVGTTGTPVASEKYDKAILSKRRTPSELILDAGYSDDVKKELIDLGLRRYDARVILDAGLEERRSYAGVLEWYNNTFINGDAALVDKLNNFIFSKECQTYKVRDPFTGKIIRVTSTYFIAANLPTHFENIGNHIPFVGSEYATLTGHVRNSLTPIIDADDLEVKEQLYTNKFNFFECIAEDTFSRAVQVTAQSVTSDLSEENNVNIILEMKRMLEDYVSSNLYNFAEAEDRVIFTKDADRLFSDFRATKVRDYTVYFDMNSFEEARNILHCYLAVTFRTMATRGIIEIDINKRA